MPRPYFLAPPAPKGVCVGGICNPKIMRTHAVRPYNTIIGSLNYWVIDLLNDF